MSATFTWDLSYTLKKNNKPKLLVTSYGDGYDQRTKDGINNNPLVYSVIVKNRLDAEMDAIEAFLEERGGTKPFWWTPPGSSTPLKFICEAWPVDRFGFNQNTLTAEFKQTFMPDAP